MAKKEDRTINEFVEYLTQSLGVAVAVQPISETHLEKRPDFLIKAGSENYLVEIKAIHNRDEVKVNAMWGAAVGRLHKAIDENPKKQQIKGSFLIDTPANFKLPTTNDPSVELADKIIDNLLQFGSKRKRTFTISGFEFNAVHFLDRDGWVSFADSSRGGSFNAARTINENIVTKVIHAAFQLKYTPSNTTINKRILLLSNEYVFGDPRSVIEGLSYSLDELRNLNIDEIWLQLVTYSTDEVHHDLILTREFMNGFFDGSIPADSDSIRLFEKWFTALDAKGDEYKGRLFTIMKQLFLRQRPDSLISNERYVRQEMVRIGEWLVKQGRFDDAKWLIERFIDDSDPAAETEEIKDAHSITTVLGHLAWVIQKLTVHKDQIEAAFAYTVKLSQHPNLYIKLQSLVPLIEITKRRIWLQEIDAERGTSYYEQLKALDFELLRQYAHEPTMAEWLAHLFFSFRNLTTDEALEVLRLLQKADDASALYVYFAIFRQRHFRNADDTPMVPFNPLPIENELKRVIENYKTNSNLVDSIAWQLAKLVRESPDEFDSLKPWIERLLKLPYYRNVYDDLERVLPYIFNKDTTLAATWFRTIIDRVYEHTAKKQTVAASSSSDGIWLSFDGAINEFAKSNPSDFSDYLRKIAEIWKKGAYVGDPRKILTAYNHITDLNLKQEAKELSKAIYAEMKELNPRLHTVEWP